MEDDYSEDPSWSPMELRAPRRKFEFTTGEFKKKNVVVITGVIFKMSINKS